MHSEIIWIFSDTKSESLANIVLNNLFPLGLSDNLKIYNRIESIDELRQYNIENENQIIYFIFDNKEMSTYITQVCRGRKIKYFDVHNIVFGILSRIISRTSKGEDISKVINETINKDLIDFATINDDGKNPHSIIESDIVIIGISRTMKTPLSIYMSNLGYKVTNLPLVPEINLPKEIFEIPKEKIFALTMSQERLVAIRKERLKSLGLPQDADYASPERVKEELDHEQSVVERLGCRSIDVSYISIEETSDIIKNLLNKF